MWGAATSAFRAALIAAAMAMAGISGGFAQTPATQASPEALRAARIWWR